MPRIPSDNQCPYSSPVPQRLGSDPCIAALFSDASHLVTSISCIPEQAVEFPHMTSCRRQLDLACRIVTDFQGRGIIDDGMECPECPEIGGAECWYANTVYHNSRELKFICWLNYAAPNWCRMPRVYAKWLVYGVEWCRIMQCINASSIIPDHLTITICFWPPRRARSKVVCVRSSPEGAK